MSQLYSNVFDDLASRVNAEINPYVTELLRGTNDKQLPILYGPALRDLRGHWRDRISLAPAECRPLVLEIGCHLGKTIREMAQAHPEIDFVGMDITFKRVVTTAQRAIAARLNNIHVILGSAKQLNALAGPAELDGIVLFFPDPWGKRRKQRRNRLVDESFCRMVGEILRPGGFLWFKTDHREYFDQACERMTQAGFSLRQDRDGLVGETFVSTFERKFRAENLPIYEAIWVNLPKD